MMCAVDCLWWIPRMWLVKKESYRTVMYNRPVIFMMGLLISGTCHKKKKRKKTNVLMSFTCFGLINRKSCWTVAKICVRGLSSRSWRTILKKYLRLLSSKSFFLLKGAGLRKWAKIQLISFVFPTSLCENPWCSVLIDQKIPEVVLIVRVCSLFVIRVRATFRTLYSQTSRYEFFLPCSSLGLRETRIHTIFTSVLQKPLDYEQVTWS